MGAVERTGLYNFVRLRADVARSVSLGAAQDLLQQGQASVSFFRDSIAMMKACIKVLTVCLFDVHVVFSFQNEPIRIPDPAPLPSEPLPWANTEETTQLWQLVHSGDLQSLATWLYREPEKVHLRAEDGRGPLFWANEYEKYEIVRIFTDFCTLSDQTLHVKTWTFLHISPACVCL
jgi:hypothetical protein